jgi:hypothetical protein
MRTRLPLLRASGLPFGFVFTLTADNLADVPWAAELAVQEGACLLQVHPLLRRVGGRWRSGGTVCRPGLALVVEADATVVPLQHGLDRGLALGNLRERPLAALIARYRRDGYRGLRDVCVRTTSDLTATRTAAGGELVRGGRASGGGVPGGRD